MNNTDLNNLLERLKLERDAAERLSSSQHYMDLYYRGWFNAMKFVIELINQEKE